jgi:L-arabinose transport system substrate-binding protein
MNRKNGVGLRHLAVALAALMAFSGYAVAQDIKMARIVKVGTDPFFVDETEGMRAMAEELGIELLVQDVQLDADLTITTMDTMIAAGVQAIALTVPDQGIGPAVIAKAKEAGVLLIAPHDPISDADGNPAPFISWSSPEMGKAVGEEAARIYNELGWGGQDIEVRIAAMETSTIDVCMQRSDFATEAFQNAVPGFADKVLHIPAVPETVEYAITSMATVSTANPQVTHWLIWGCSDNPVVGAIRALEQAGFTGESIIGVGIGGQLACAEWAAPKETGFRGVVFLDAGDSGRVIIKTLYDHLKSGEPLPEFTGMTLFKYTKDNHPLLAC